MEFFVKGYIPFGIYDGGVMIGKFLKKLLSCSDVRGADRGVLDTAQTG